jgi:hypothetical protein
MGIMNEAAAIISETANNPKVGAVEAENVGSQFSNFMAGNINRRPHQISWREARPGGGLETDAGARAPRPHHPSSHSGLEAGKNSPSIQKAP